MKTLSQQDYYFLPQRDVRDNFENPKPLFKVCLYADLLKEAPLDTLFIRILKEPPVSDVAKQEFYEDCIVEILRKHHQKVFAYENEQIN